MLEQQKANDKPSLDPGAALLAVERSNLPIDEIPVDLAGELHQLVLHADDLVQPSAEQITRSRRLVLLRPHRPLRRNHRISPPFEGISKTKLQASRGSDPKNLQLKPAKPPENESRSIAWQAFHSRPPTS